MDARQKFVIAAATRGEIAKELNEYMLSNNYRISPFTPGDERLTDEICTHWCGLVSRETECLDVGITGQARAAACYRVLITVLLANPEQDAEETFSIGCRNRAQIANELNNYLEVHERTRQTICKTKEQPFVPRRRFTPTDPRLTKEACRDYVRELARFGDTDAGLDAAAEAVLNPIIVLDVPEGK